MTSKSSPEDEGTNVDPISGWHLSDACGLEKYKPAAVTVRASISHVMTLVYGGL